MQHGIGTTHYATVDFIHSHRRIIDTYIILLLIIIIIFISGSPNRPKSFYWVP